MLIGAGTNQLLLEKVFHILRSGTVVEGGECQGIHFPPILQPLYTHRQAHHVAIVHKSGRSLNRLAIGRANGRMDLSGGWVGGWGHAEATAPRL